MYDNKKKKLTHYESTLIAHFGKNNEVVTEEMEALADKAIAIYNLPEEWEKASKEDKQRAADILTARIVESSRKVSIDNKKKYADVPSDERTFVW